MITSSSLDLRRPSPQPAVVDAELRHYRQAIGILVAVTAGISGLLSFFLYFLGVPPPGQVSVEGWWEWLQAAGRVWDPISTLGLLSGVTLPLVIATSVNRVLQKSNSTDAAHAASVDTDEDTATVITLEEITMLACVLAATVSWMLVPVTLNAPAATAMRTVPPIFLGLVFSALAAVSRPSDKARQHRQERARRYRDRLVNLCTHLEAHVAQFNETSAPAQDRTPKSTDAIRYWRRLAAIGAIYGASVGAALVIVTLTTSLNESWWGLSILAILSTLYNAVILPAFATMRASTTNQRLLHGRWSNIGINLALLGLALCVFAGAASIALTGRYVAGIAIALTGFGPALIFRVMRGSRHVAGLQFRNARQRLKAFPEPVATRASNTRPRPTPRPA